MTRHDAQWAVYYIGCAVLGALVTLIALMWGSR